MGKIIEILCKKNNKMIIFVSVGEDNNIAINKEAKYAEDTSLTNDKYKEIEEEEE